MTRAHANDSRGHRPPRLLVLSLVSALLGVAMAGSVGENETKPFRIGFSTSLFTDVNETDAKASIKAWAQTVAQERGISMNPTAQLYDRTDEIVDAMRRGVVDAMSMTFDEYVAVSRSVPTSYWFLTKTSGSLNEEYILLVHADAEITNLRELEGRNLILHDSARTSLARDWLDHQVVSRGHGAGADGFFATIESVSKISAAVLPVFFGKADAAVVAESSFTVMAELNPQLRRSLKTVAKSPPLVPAIMCFREDFESPEKELLMTALRKLDETPAGEQVLTIFQSQGLVLVDEGQLRETTSFVEEIERMRSRTIAEDRSSEERPER